MSASVASVAGSKEKSLKDGMKNPFGQCASHTMGAMKLSTSTKPRGEYQKQAVKDTEAMLQADRYELVCRKRIVYRGLLRLFSVFTGEQDPPAPDHANNYDCYIIRDRREIRQVLFRKRA